MYAATASSRVAPVPNDTTVVVVVGGVVVAGGAVVVEGAPEVLVADEPVGVRRPSEFPDPEHPTRRTAPATTIRIRAAARRVTRAA